MILSIKNAIVRAIAGTDESYEVYDEQVEQDLAEPCFRIMNVENSDTRRVDTRNRLETSWEICYFPASANSLEAECHQVEWNVLRALRMISLADNDGNVWHKIHGTNRHSEIVDGVLHVFVEYNTFYMDTEDTHNKLNNLSLTILVTRK